MEQSKQKNTATAAAKPNRRSDDRFGAAQTVEVDVEALRNEVKDLTEKLEILKAKRAADQEKLRENDRLKLQAETFKELVQKLRDENDVLRKTLEVKSSKQRIFEENKAQTTAIDLDYSVSNPILLAPKRRGRPKKDPNAPAVPKKKDVVDIKVEFPDKPKRITKPPKRYGEEEAEVKKEETEPHVEDKLSEDPYLQYIESDPISSIEKVNFPGNVELFDFGVIMQDDAYVQPEVRNVSNVVTEKADDDGNSSDASVRTIDIVRKKQTKKKKKKRKGVKKIREQIRCPIPDCDFVYHYKASLNYHQERVHDKTIRFYCQTCKQGFTHEKLLKLHHLSHSQEKKFKCDECIAKFKTKSSLFTHRRTVHLKSKDYNCDTCDRKFTLKSSLNSHIRIHTGSKPFSCEFCGKSFAQDSNLRAHIRTHTGDKPFKCDWEACSKAFITSTQLKLHKASHLGGKPYLCAKCGKGFASYDSFKYHENGHSGLKPFKCDKCDSSFPSPWGHKRHVKLHDEEKPYKCKLCEQAFKDPSNLNKHIKLHDKKLPQRIEEQETVQAEPMLEINPDDLLKLNATDENGLLYFSPEVFNSFVTITVVEDNQTIVDNQITLESLGVGMPMTYTLENGEADYYTLEADSENIQDQIGIDNGIKFVLHESPEQLLQEALQLQHEQET